MLSKERGVLPREKSVQGFSQAESYVGYKRFCTGDVIMNKMQAWNGVFGLAESSGIVSPDYAVFRPYPNVVDARFLVYLLKDPIYAGIFSGISRGMGTGFNRVHPEQFLKVPVSLPSLEEQNRIADYIDKEVGKINELTSKKRRLTSLLNERIDSSILQHVGSSQLVDCENGSPIFPIRRALSKVSRPPATGVDVITAYRDGQVTGRGTRRAEGYTLSASTEPQGQYVHVGDVVVHGLDGFAGAIGTSETAGNCSPVYHVCVPNAGGNALYLGRLLRLLATQGYLGNFATSTRERAVDFRNWDLFGRIPIPRTPPAEQHEIGEWIAKIRPLREVIERSIARAAERRQSLITAAVTGQFDVTSASGRNADEEVEA
jgi:type I restriction enzyme S subunit